MRTVPARHGPLPAHPRRLRLGLPRGAGPLRGCALAAALRQPFGGKGERRFGRAWAPVAGVN